MSGGKNRVIAPVAISLALSFIFSFSLSLAPAEPFKCLSDPVREDNIWQNWYVENNCEESITLHYTDKSKDGKIGNAVAPSCKRGRVLQVFPSDEIIWNPSYDQHSSPRLCSKAAEAQASDPKRSTKSEQVQSYASEKEFNLVPIAAFAAVVNGFVQAITSQGGSSAPSPRPMSP
jgi:hypothetical protein